MAYPTFNYHQITPSQDQRRSSLTVADGESAVSTSSGASSNGSGASNNYENYEEDVDQVISPETPIRTLVAPKWCHEKV